MLEQIHAHPESICRYVFTDPVHKYLLMTKDCGQTVTSHALEEITCVTGAAYAPSLDGVSQPGSPGLINSVFDSDDED